MFCEAKGGPMEAARAAGKAPSAATWFVTRYWQLFLLRLLTGVSLGGIFPLVRGLPAPPPIPPYFTSLPRTRYRRAPARVTAPCRFSGMPSVRELTAWAISRLWG